jgi:hypothetical protein
MWSPQWKDIDRGKPKDSEKNLSQCHVVHHKSHWIDLGANPGRRVERPATNRPYLYVTTECSKVTQTNARLLMRELFIKRIIFDLSDTQISGNSRTVQSQAGQVRTRREVGRTGVAMYADLHDQSNYFHSTDSSAV